LKSLENPYFLDFPRTACKFVGNILGNILGNKGAQ
jgi:hypothetical protein